MAIRTSAKWVTLEDFKNYYGEDLSAICDFDGNVSNGANLFLMRVENRLITWIDANTFRIYPWDKLTDYQTECLQTAILMQANYIIRNSDLTYDSGYDPDRGEIMSMEKISSIEINRASIEELKKCGLYNHKVHSLPRFPRFF